MITEAELTAGQADSMVTESGQSVIGINHLDPYKFYPLVGCSRLAFYMMLHPFKVVEVRLHF